MNKITSRMPLQAEAIRTRQVILTVTVGNKIISMSRHLCHTVNRNFWNAVLISQANLTGVVTNFGAGYISLKKTNGAVTATVAGQTGIFLDGPVSDAARGIVIGSGNAAESFEGYVLNSVIAHGSSAGLLLYAASPAPTRSYDAGLLKWTTTQSRSFTNSSGGAINVNEIAMYAIFYNINVMLWRDLLGATVEIPNNAVLTVAYDITLTLPA